MKVLELFSGSRSIGKVAEKRGHQVFSSDIYPFEGTNYVCDILEFNSHQLPFVPDVIWASPPCESFSVASIGKHWIKGEEFTPKTDKARKGIQILLQTLSIIDYFLAKNSDLVWFVENPRGKMRKCPNWALREHKRDTVTYCQYGDERMKPTDIWNNCMNWIPKPMCKNGDSCHVPAPRGSRTGTQGIATYYDKSRIPEELCMEIITNAEKNKT